MKNIFRGDAFVRRLSVDVQRKANIREMGYSRLRGPGYTMKDFNFSCVCVEGAESRRWDDMPTVA